jgi:hypothetical protein
VCWNITRVKSVVTVQRAFRAKHAKDPPTDKTIRVWYKDFNPLKPELNSICYLLALLAHHFLHVSRIRVKSLTFR